MFYNQRLYHKLRLYVKKLSTICEVVSRPFPRFLASMFTKKHSRFSQHQQTNK
jgi:hypothetical protein